MSIDVCVFVFDLLFVGDAQPAAAAAAGGLNHVTEAMKGECNDRDRGSAGEDSAREDGISNEDSGETARHGVGEAAGAPPPVREYAECTLRANNPRRRLYRQRRHREYTAGKCSSSVAEGAASAAAVMPAFTARAKSSIR